MKKVTGYKPAARDTSWRFWLIFGYAAIVVVFAAIVAWGISQPVSDDIIEQETQSLRSVAQAGAASIAINDDYATIVNESVADTNLRTTLIDENGNVLIDSEQEASTMSNHSDRPEVVQAKETGFGSYVRDSASDGNRRLYVAVPVEMNAQTAVYRVSAPLSDLKPLTDKLGSTAIVLVALGIVVAIIIAWTSYRYTASPVNRLERVRTDFVANASHELKTPVAGIRLLSDAIEKASDDMDFKTTKEFAQRLDSEASRLQRLVTELLDLSRLEEERSTIHSRTDLYSCIRTSCEAHRSQAQDKGLQLSLLDRTDKINAYQVELNASDASLIIDNLIENAIRYTEAGEITVIIEADETTMTIGVRDTGIGIPGSEQSRIFERFYRVDKGRSREVGGTGLGLSLVRHAVERGNGSIMVRSIEGEGSLFTVKLPRVR